MSTSQCSKMSSSASSEAAIASPKSDTARKRRTSRPNHKHIYRFPLPISVHPLPPLIPHNPLSIISVALSYLTYIISPPYHEVYSAYFDTATSSVHVTDEKAIRILWEMGFFGKGSLSRSEPSWLEREMKKKGLMGGNTNEEITRKRRSERRELKLERARMEKLAVDQRLEAEAAAKESGAKLDLEQQYAPPTTDGNIEGADQVAHKFSLRKAREAKLHESLSSEGRDLENGGANEVLEKVPPSNPKSVRFLPVVQQKEYYPDGDDAAHLPDLDIDGHTTDEETFKNEEHLQLSNEEAFFLVYGLGALQVFDEERNNIVPASSLFSLFCRHSYFPPRDFAEVEPDNPFVISYVVYHHYRSLGWVVRSGVKFGVDYLLYNRGPVFSHAEFAVVVVPSYSHTYWTETPQRRDRATIKQTRSWWWLHCVNRVQAQVKKTLVVCYVDMPPPAPNSLQGDIGEQLRRYSIRDVSIRRWVPNRSRD